jgi:hypothetical protein
VLGHHQCIVARECAHTGLGFVLSVVAGIHIRVVA